MLIPKILSSKEEKGFKKSLKKLSNETWINNWELSNIVLFLSGMELYRNNKKNTQFPYYWKAYVYNTEYTSDKLKERLLNRVQDMPFSKISIKKGDIKKEKIKNLKKVYYIYVANDWDIGMNHFLDDL